MKKIKRLDQKKMDNTLDDLLNYLKTTIFIDDQDYIQHLNAIDIFFFCYGEEKAQIHNYTEPKLYLEKLYKDGFVNFKEAENAYQINLNGIEFINNGGYNRKSRNLLLKRVWDILKIIAILINAILLLVFAYFSYEKNQKESIHNKEKQSQVENKIEVNSRKNNY